MALRDIKTQEADVLHQAAQPVLESEYGSEELRQLVSDMIETMTQANGVGLAGPQVGLAKRLFIAESPFGPVALINPIITNRSWKQVKDEEGCLSVPGEFGKVKRAKSVSVEAVTVDGKPVKFQAKDFFARIIQHEYDHLDGILFTDRIKEQKDE